METSDIFFHSRMNKLLSETGPRCCDVWGLQTHHPWKEIPVFSTSSQERLFSHRGTDGWYVSGGWSNKVISRGKPNIVTYQYHTAVHTYQSMHMPVKDKIMFKTCKRWEVVSTVDGVLTSKDTATGWILHEHVDRQMPPTPISAGASGVCVYADGKKPTINKSSTVNIIHCGAEMCSGTGVWPLTRRPTSGEQRRWLRLFVMSTIWKRKHGNKNKMTKQPNTRESNESMD